MRVFIGKSVARLSKAEYNHLTNSFRKWKSSVKANPKFDGNREDYVEGPWTIQVEIETNGKIERFDISFDEEV